MKYMQAFQDAFKNLTTPQALVISAGLLSFGLIASAACDAGLAPDFDFKNWRFRFTQPEADQEQN